MPNFKNPFQDDDIWDREKMRQFSREEMCKGNDQLHSYLQGIEDGISMAVQAIFRELSQGDGEE